MVRVILTLSLLLLPLHASASFEYLPNSDDGSLSLLKQLFGDFPCIWLEACSVGRDTTLFVEVLGIVTGVLFLIAAGYYAINVFVGLGHTARTGQFLGNWDSLSMPFWTGASAIMIAPNPLMLGLAPIHALLMLLVLLSTGPANMAWHAAIKYTDTGALVVEHDINTVSEKNAEMPFSMLKSEVCTWTLLKETQQADSSIRHNITTEDQQYVGYWEPQEKTISDLKIYHRNISWGVEGFKDGICGRLFFPIRNESQHHDAVKALANNIQKHNAVAINQLLKDVRKIAYSIVYSDTAGYHLSFAAQKNLMAAAIKNYQKTLLEKTKTAHRIQSKQILKEFVDNAKQGGWIYAASWFWKMADLQSRVSAALSMNNNRFKLYTDELDIPENIKTILNDNNAQVEKLLDKISPTSGMTTEIRQMEESGELDFMDRLSLRLGGAITSIIISDQENPLMAMKRVGDNLKTTGTALLGIGAGASMFPTLTDSAHFIAPIVNIIAGLLITSGVVLGQWIPMMPYITFFFAIAGWLLLVCSAFLAASIWGFMHASPHGLNHVKPGYTFLIDLWLRPLLLVCGLITGYIIYITMNGVLNDTLFRTIALSSFTSTWDALGTIVIYVIIQISLATLCFSFIWKIPASITNLYSGSSNVLVSSGSEQANSQIQRSSMIVAGVPGSIASSKQKTPKAEPDDKPKSNSLRSSEDAYQEYINPQPSHYVHPEIDNKELLPQSHAPSDEAAPSSNDVQQELNFSNNDQAYDEYLASQTTPNKPNNDE